MSDKEIEFCTICMGSGVVVNRENVEKDGNHIVNKYTLKCECRTRKNQSK